LRGGYGEQRASQGEAVLAADGGVISGHFDQVADLLCRDGDKPGRGHASLSALANVSRRWWRPDRGARSLARTASR